MCMVLGDQSNSRALADDCFRNCHRIADVVEIEGTSLAGIPEPPQLGDGVGARSGQVVDCSYAHIVQHWPHEV